MKINRPAKKIIVLLITVFVYCIGYAQSVIIHHIGIGQGDATLILISNKAGQQGSILIDAGNSKSKGDAVFSVVNGYLGSKKQLDIIIVSHLHSDHMGGMPEVLGKLEDGGWTVRYVFDRAARGQNNGDNELCYDNAGFGENDEVQAIPSSQIVKTYQNAVLALKGNPVWLNLNCGVDLLSFCFGDWFKNSGMVFRSLTSNGYVCTNASDYSDKIQVVSNSKYENDNSYAFLFEMGQFKYFTGGDIGGETPYADLETPLLNYIKTRQDAQTFHFCAYKASHHGSKHSTNAAFIAKTVPTVNVVPSALRSFSGTQLPGQSTIQRIENSSQNRYLYYTYTYQQNPWEGKVGDYKDVIITVNGATYSTNHTMVITQQNRDKTDLTLKGTTTTENAVCNKQH